MKVLSDEAARDWLHKLAIAVDDKRKLSFQNTDKAIQIWLSSPTIRERVVDLAVNLVGILGGSSEWLLWLTEFDIWNEEAEEIGWHVVDTFLQNAKQPKLSLNSSAIYFQPSEQLSVKAMLLVSILFMWDAYLIKGDGQIFIRIDHDDLSYIAIQNQSLVREIQDSQLSSWITTRLKG
jgi:hypothetical protein